MNKILTLHYSKLLVAFHYTSSQPIPSPWSPDSTHLVPIWSTILISCHSSHHSLWSQAHQLSFLFFHLFLKLSRFISTLDTLQLLFLPPGKVFLSIFPVAISLSLASKFKCYRLRQALAVFEIATSSITSFVLFIYVITLLHLFYS